MLKILKTAGMVALLMGGAAGPAYADKLRDVLDRGYLIFMQDGRIGEEGAPKEMFKNPKTERLAAFLKSSKF